MTLIAHHIRGVSLETLKSSRNREKEEANWNQTILTLSNVRYCSGLYLATLSQNSYYFWVHQFPSTSIRASLTITFCILAILLCPLDSGTSLNFPFAVFSSSFPWESVMMTSLSTTGAGFSSLFLHLTCSGGLILRSLGSTNRLYCSWLNQSPTP